VRLGLTHGTECADRVNHSCPRLAIDTLHVEYAERYNKFGILFTCNLFCEYIGLAHVRVPVIYRVNQAECGIHVLVAASKEYVLNVPCAPK